MENNDNALVYIRANLKSGVRYTVISDSIMGAMLWSLNHGYDIKEISNGEYSYNTDKKMFFNLKESPPKILLSASQNDFLQKCIAEQSKF